MDAIKSRKLIAKNTVMLYFRQIFLLAVNLYSIRVILTTLGTVDYGIYNVIAGIVTTFNFLSVAMSSATQRFYSFFLGKDDFDVLQKVFCITVEIYIFIILIVVAASETAGLWFVQNKLLIPLERMDAAKSVFHLVVISFASNLFSTPFLALIISHENMNVYAFISISEGVLKLASVLLLRVISFDSLVMYGFLLAAISVIIAFAYYSWCRKSYTECRFSLQWDKVQLQEILSFSGWCLFGTCAGIAKNQITNILLNMFFGPVVNAARGIAYNVNSAVSSFSANFNMAVRPQIIKTYSVNEKNTSFDLVFQSTKLSYFLLWIFMCPLFLEMHYVLKLWLTNVPDMSVTFTRLILIEVLFDSVSYPLQSLSQASGKMKLYQSVVGGVLLLNLPLAYLALKKGFDAYCVQYIAIVIAFVALLLRIIINSVLTDLQVSLFIRKALFPSILASFLSAILPCVFHFSMAESFSMCCSIPA